MNEDTLRALYQDGLRRDRKRTDEPCPAPEALLELAEQRGAEDERLTVLDHVISCAACHQDFELLRAVRESVPGAEPSLQSRYVSLARPLIAAAATLILLVVGAVAVREMVADRFGPTVMRGDDASVSLISPVGIVQVGEVVELTWHAVSGASSYQVEVLDASAEPLFTLTTSDTTAAVPSSLLRRGEEYRWWVRAQVAGGAQVRSRLEAFRLPAQ